MTLYNIVKTVNVCKTCFTLNIFFETGKKLGFGHLVSLLDMSLRKSSQKYGSLLTFFHFRIKGTGLPKFLAREDLAQVVVDLAKKVDVPMEKRDIAKVWRNFKRTAIIVQFTSSVMGSPMHSLQSRETSGKLENLQLIILPLLTHPDEALYWKARKMAKDKKIDSCFISSRQHIVMIRKDKDSQPVPVYEEADLDNI